jgi:hypothetical protein
MSSSQQPSTPPPNTKKPQQFTFSLDTPSLSSNTLEGYLKGILGNESLNNLPEIFTGSDLNLTKHTNSLSTTDSQEHTRENSTTSSSMQEQQRALPSSSLVVSLMEKLNSSTSSSSNQQHHTDSHSPSNEGQGITSLVPTEHNSTDLIPVARGQSYVDITEYLNMPQSEASKKLGIPASTLSKRWKEAVRKRKWPYRMVCKIDKEIMTLLHNVPQGPNAPPLPPEIETALGHLLKKRQEELRPVVIRL